MSFQATFTLNGKKFDALDASYECERDVDQKGRPSSKVYGCKIMGVVESTGDNSIFESMCSEHKPFSGDIVFKQSNEDAEMKKVEFENAYVVKFKEEFERETKKPMTISFTLTAQKVTCGSATHKEDWPEG